MKAKELMIGDWVNFFCDIYEKVRVIQDDFNNPTFFPRTKPILITSEILEKSGLFCCLNKTHLDFYGVVESLEISLIKKYKSELYSLRIRKVDREYINIDIRYVHELQHALRLAGIEKEIVL